MSPMPAGNPAEQSASSNAAASTATPVAPASPAAVPGDQQAMKQTMQGALQKALSGMTHGFSPESVNEILASLASRCAAPSGATASSDPAFDALIARAHRVTSQVVDHAQAHPDHQELKPLLAGLLSSLTIVCALIDLPGCPGPAMPPGSPAQQGSASLMLKGLASKLGPILDAIEDLLRNRSS